MSDSMNDNDFYTEGSLAQTPLDSNFEFLTGNADTPMPQDAEGIEILVHMAKTGKIDPWNIDIVDIAEKYLAHVLTMKANNLKMTGRTLLFLAILLKLKSDVLEGIDIVDFEDIKDMDVVIFAVAHKEFENLTEEELSKMFGRDKKIVIDVKGIVDCPDSYIYWSL